jgi:RNA polymerase sigma factor (sigma-70 family)
MDIIEAVKLAKKSNKEGITYLYESTYQKGYYIALKYLKNEQNAEDVLQDSYIKAFQSIEQLEDESKFESWLGRIIATRSLNELKKKNPILFSETKNEEEGDISFTFEDDRVDISPELAIDQQETSRLIKDMMADLSDEQRMCVTMFYMEEMTIKEIAETLAVSENTVKSRLYYGRDKIKNKVLELEKKGTILYGMLPIVFFCTIFKKEALACEIAIPNAEGIYAATITSKTGVAAKAAFAKASAGTAKTGLVFGNATISTKGIIAAVTAAIVISGGVGTVAYLKNNSDEQIEVDDSGSNSTDIASNEISTNENNESNESNEDYSTDINSQLSEEVSNEEDVVVDESDEYEADEVIEEAEETMIVDSTNETNETITIFSSDISGQSPEDASNEVAEVTNESNEVDTVEVTEEAMVVDSTYAYISGRYISDKGNVISISTSTEYDGEYPDGTIDGNAENMSFSYMYLEPISVNVYDIKIDWNYVTGTGYVLTGCDGGDTVRLYKDGVLVETFSLIEHYYS